MQQLNFRLSYNDIKLFLAIAQSLPSLKGQDYRESDARKNSRKKEKEVDGKQFWEVCGGDEGGGEKGGMRGVGERGGMRGVGEEGG